MADPDAGNTGGIAKDLVKGMVPLDGDVPPLGFLDDPVGQDLLGPETVPAVDHGDVAGDVGKIECLLNGGAPPSHTATGLPR